MKLDIIDKYLAGEMTTEERLAFEQEMERDPKLKEDVHIIAYIIHGIRQVGLEEENKRLQRIIASSASDKRRYAATIAAIFIAGFIIAATISVPVYHVVVKPLIEKINDHGNQENNELSRQNTDSVFTKQEVDSTTVINEEVQQEETQQGNDELNDEKAVVQENSSKKEEQNEQQNDIKPEEDEQKPVTTIGNSLSVDIGENGTRYVIEQAEMNGKELIITIVISNNEDDEIIQLTSASLVDSYGETKNGSTPERFLLNKGTKIRKQIHFYNISKIPDFLQILKIKENDGKILKFRNIPIT